MEKTKVFFSKVKQYCRKNENLRIIIILSIFTVVYNFIWINKTYTLSTGWSKFYSELIGEGKVPYRDFYYYLPPLNLLVDSIIWKLSFDYFILYRLWRLLERVLIIISLYILISKRINKYIAFIGSLFTVVLASATVYDTGGDYNQTTQLLIVLIVMSLSNYSEQLNNGINKKVRFIWAFIVGVIGGLMFLEKQTVAVACAISFFLLFLIFVLSKYEDKWYITLAMIALGALVPIGIAFLYLLSNGAYESFVYQVFRDTSSKGTLYSIIVERLLDFFKTRIIVIVSILLIYFSKKFCNKQICYYIKSFSIAMILYFEKDLIITLVSTLTNIKLDGFESFIISIYGNGDLFGYLRNVVSGIYLMNVLWIIHHILSRHNKEPYDYKALILAFASFASGYLSLMTSGIGNMSGAAAFVIVPAFFYLFFRDVHLSKGIILTLILSWSVIFVIALSQKMVCPYSWWGDTEDSYWDKTEQSSVKALKGFYFSKEEKKKYDLITDLIDSYTDEDSVIWGFPYVKSYNIFLSNYNMNGFVPVEFYDICADDYAIKEAELLAKNEPDIVVWTDIPGCMETHEKVFRDGKELGQRKIQEWFSNVKDTDYSLIGQIDNIFVYKLKDGTTITNTVIESSTRPNKTAIYESVEEMYCTLSGDGSIESPYLIGSYNDLSTFRDLVNNGYSFSGEYVRQTNDIDMSEDDNWIPIGIFGTENLFKGTYDGDGYIISNLTIKTDGNASLFGILAGTVENLVVYDCDINAVCTGGITSHGNSSKIVNCLVKGKIVGTGRAGGIADNTGAYICNCVAIVDLEGGIKGGISSYYTNIVDNCYSNYGNEYSFDNGYTIDEKTITELNSFVTNNNKDYDGLLNEWKYEDGEYFIIHD